MIYLEPEKCNAEHAATLRCPTCGEPCALRPHGWYWRGMVDAAFAGLIADGASSHVPAGAGADDGGSVPEADPGNVVAGLLAGADPLAGLADCEVTESRVRIRRVICRSCRTTHALIPTTLVPHRPYTVRLLLLVLRCCVLASMAPSAVEEAFHASLSTVASVRSDLGRVTETLGCAIASLADALAEEAASRVAEAAMDAPAFALGFEAEHGTAPFSRVRFPGRPRRLRSGGRPQHNVAVMPAPGPP